MCLWARTNNANLLQKWFVACITRPFVRSSCFLWTDLLAYARTWSRLKSAEHRVEIKLLSEIFKLSQLNKLRFIVIFQSYLKYQTIGVETSVGQPRNELLREVQLPFIHSKTCPVTQPFGRRVYKHRDWRRMLIKYSPQTIVSIFFVLLLVFLGLFLRGRLFQRVI